jgi:endonuclease/exonuclease/phosphatase family metal-dependent hydrolase
MAQVLMHRMEALMQHRMISRVTLALTLALLLGVGACGDNPTTVPDSGAAFSRGAPAAAPAPVRVMSRNLYLGADIDHVLADPVGGGDIAWAEIMHTSYPERAVRIAGEILARMPHVVGLQEVSQYLVLDPTTFNPVGGFDFLEILMAHLAGHGYSVVTRATNFQAYIPMGGYIVRYTDGDAILALAGVDVITTGWKHFEHQVDLNEYVPGLGDNLRSFQWADLVAAGQRMLFVNTHLEIQMWGHVQVLQAAELLQFVDAWGGPVIMVGDFNSAANRNAPAQAQTATYAMVLGAGFNDLWLPHDGVANNSGPSCCQASDLSNRASQLDERIDFIFARDVPYWQGNRSAAAKLELFGHRPADRFPAAGGYDLWPSDHAGLFGEIRFGAAGT